MKHNGFNPPAAGLPSAPKLRYEGVRDFLLDELARLRDGDRLLPERDLSTRLRVDRATIRRAMQDLSQEGFIVRHQGRGTFVRKPHEPALPKVGDVESGAPVALSIPGIDLPIHQRFIDAVEQEIVRRGGTLQLYNARLSTRREWHHLQQLVKQDTRGIIAMPFEDDSLRSEYVDLINALKQAGKRVVLLDQYIPELDVPVAMSNRKMIGYRATEHLIMLGHKRIAYATAGRFDTAGLACLAGYKEALADYGVEYREELVIERPLAFCATPIRDAVRDMLKANSRSFTAIATEHFSMTFGIVKALELLGLTPDMDIGVVGAELFQNPTLLYLTHTAQCIDEMCQGAVRLLLDPPAPSGQKHVLLEPRLVIGQPKDSLPAKDDLEAGLSRR